VLIEIKHRYSGAVLFSLECGSLKIAVEAAVKSHADLTHADLAGAYLAGADLTGANLAGAYLTGAYLAGGVLDPTKSPNAQSSAFVERDGEWVIGYRTRATSAAGRQLQDDRIYGTAVFSVAETECHPGWYLWPTLQQSRDFSKEGPYITVKARIKDVHQAGAKWRSRAIWVIGDAK